MQFRNNLQGRDCAGGRKYVNAVQSRCTACERCNHQLLPLLAVGTINCYTSVRLVMPPIDPHMTRI
eukprot:6213137-Pleurochrysis_carterae.AAC.2